ncbi:MAG: CPBP family intramembrane metalloprotease [Phycisphaerales bacterium]|nr:CPBP family intramembrane metalloprotease [Phycisphaerales bacterium]
MPLPLRFAKPAKQLSQSYFEQSRQPLTMLVFLAPLILMYEFALYRAEQNIQVKAHDHLVRMFEYADLPPTQGLFFGGVLIVTILLIWQINSKYAWRVEPKTITLMAGESIAAALPLLVLGVVFGSMVATNAETAIGSLSLFDKVAVSIGAGLYEELVFRMMTIALIHTIACHLFKQSESNGLIAGVLISALLFALYHDLPDAGSLPAVSLFFYGVAGIYLGVLFVFRGFGIAAGAHAAYDVVATAILAVLAT